MSTWLRLLLLHRHTMSAPISSAMYRRSNRKHSKISSSFVATIIRATIHSRNCESFAKTMIDFKLSNRLKASLARDYDTGRVVYDHKNAKIRKDISKRRHVALHFCGSQWITNLYRTSFIRQHHISFQTRASGLEWDCDDIFILNILLNNPKIAFCDNVFYHYYQRSTSAVHQINALRFTSTIKSRQIETELLNQYYRDKKISKKDYISLISRLLIELSKHYRIYSSQEHFDKHAYLSGMQEIVEAAIYCPSYSFVERLESKDLDAAGKRLSTKPLYYIDRIRAWLSGY